MRGLTLIELLAVIAILGVLAVTALPAWHGFVADHRRAATANGLVTALQHARHDSIVRARAVSVCPVGAGRRCGTDWRAGWLVFHEPRGWTGSQPVPDDALIARFGPPPSAVVVVSNRARYRFRPHRRRATNGTLVVCEPGRPGRAIVVAPTGRVRTTATVPDWALTACT